MSKYNATFTSIWDGNFAVYSRCYVSKRKRLVTRMGRNNISSDVEGGLDTLDKQYVTLDSGETYDAVPKDEMNNYEEAVVGY